MSPCAPLARVKPLCNFDLACRIFKTGFVLALMNRVFSEIFPTSGLREQHIVLDAKLERALCPAIRLDVESTVLMCAGEVGIDLRDHRRGEAADTVARCGRCNEFRSAQQ